MSTRAKTTPPDRPDPPGGVEALGFVRKLAEEIAAGEVRLPSFPDFATRVQRLLEDPRAAPAQIAQVIAADAALAARILRLANSSFMNPSGRKINDLKRAVAQLGHQLVRCTAVSFALRQMELDGGKPELRPQLHELWRNGVLVASIAYVLARTTRAASPDEALVTGLMHNIGKLYIVVAAPKQDPAEAGAAAWANAVHEWHPRIARAILKHWGFALPIVAAVGDQTSWDRESQGGDSLTDILIASRALVPCVFYREQLDDTVTAVPPFKRLGIDDTARCKQLMADSAQQIRALHSTLSS
ncbi:MAG: HDOD domain-containing protein [Steroidobacteraceae bacterium]